VGAVIAGCSALLITGCTTTLQGKAVSVFDDPFHVAGMPATDGPTGLRPDAHGAVRDVEGTDNGEIDKLAANAVSDIEDYWGQVYGETFDGQFTPVEALISWDANGFDDTPFCGEDTYGLVNAAFCYDDDTIGWDRGELLPALRKAYGDMGVTMVLAHEYGHAVQHQAGLNNKNTPTLVSEQQADCFAGGYMRWVAEDKSPRFTLSTGDGLNNVLAAVIAFRDPLLAEGDLEVGVDEHGSAFERLSAFQFGFTDGPSRAAIDMREIGHAAATCPYYYPRTGPGTVDHRESRCSSSTRWESFSPANPPAELWASAPRAAQMPGRVRPRQIAREQRSSSTCRNLPMGANRQQGQCQLASGDNTAYSVWSPATHGPSSTHGGVVPTTPKRRYAWRASQAWPPSRCRRRRRWQHHRADGR
jgi:predicted metalloprotease